MSKPITDHMTIPEHLRACLVPCNPAAACSCDKCKSGSQVRLVRWCAGCWTLWLDITKSRCPGCGQEDVCP